MHFPQVMKQSMCLAALLVCGSVFAQSGKDHPLVGRYEGSELVGEFHKGFDEVPVIEGAIGADRMRNPQGWKVLEGKSSLYYYQLPAGRSTLEVVRNYETSLKSKGFSTVFTCATSNGSCYIASSNNGTAPYAFALALDDAPELPRLNSDYIRNYFGENARYLLAKLDRPEGAVYASIALSEHTRGNYAFVRVIETDEKMETDKIRFIGAEEMRSTLKDVGRIALYGIWFDTDKADVKPDSAPTIAEIGKLLKNDPALRIAVVGHTDAEGDDAHNQELSDRRARAVVAALTSEQGIAPERLQARGAGMTQPVAANDTEDGRARNRRVELVKI